MKRICIYCGSAPGEDDAFAAAVQALAATMLQRDIGLVYGGADRGLMGQLANAVMDGGGHVTGSLSLAITIVSTLFHISPPGKGVLSSTVLRDVMPFEDTKAWVRRHARTESGRPLRSYEDWNEWLSSPAGKTSPDAKLHRQQSMLLVPMATPGRWKWRCR